MIRPRYPEANAAGASESPLFPLARVDPTDARNRFIETAATVAIGEDRLTVAIDRRCHNPIFREAALDRHPLSITRIGPRRLVLTYR